MQFTHEMILQSDSGYCMPFEEKNKDVEMSLGILRQEKNSSITGLTSMSSTTSFQPLLQVRCRDWGMMPFIVSIRSSAMATMK